MKNFIALSIVALIVMIGCKENPATPPLTSANPGGAVFLINPATLNIDKRISFSDNLSGGIACDTAGKAYVIGKTPGSYYGGPIHKIDLSTGNITRNFFAGTIYSLGYDPFTAQLVAGDAKNFQSSGQVSIVGLDGTVKASFQAQLGPGAFAFSSRGVYILNEGNFSDPSGARLDFYDVGQNSSSLDVCETANNGVHLGSVGDDIQIANGKLYVLMSGSNEIHILNVSDNKNIFTQDFPGTAATIHDLWVDTLRHQIYVTRLYGNKISILSQDSLKTILDIPVGLNPQGLMVVGNRLFVCNSGYQADSTVSVINLDTRAVESNLVLTNGPVGIARTNDGRLAVACIGRNTGQ